MFSVKPQKLDHLVHLQLNLHSDEQKVNDYKQSIKGLLAYFGPEMM